MNGEVNQEIQKIINAGKIVMSDTPTMHLKNFRRVNGVTQTELAQQLKISPSTIAKYEQNLRKNPGCIVVRKWVDAVIEIKNKNKPELISLF